MVPFMWTAFSNTKGWRYFTGAHAQTWQGFAHEELTLVIPVADDAAVPRGYQAAQLVYTPTIFNFDDSLCVLDLARVAWEQEKQIGAGSDIGNGGIAGLFAMVLQSAEQGVDYLDASLSQDDVAQNLFIAEERHDRASIRMAANLLTMQGAGAETLSHAIRKLDKVAFETFSLDMQRGMYFPPHQQEPLVDLSNVENASHLGWLCHNPAGLMRVLGCDGFRFGGLTWMRQDKIAGKIIEPGAVIDDAALAQSFAPQIKAVWENKGSWRTRKRSGWGQPAL